MRDKGEADFLRCVTMKLRLKLNVAYWSTQFIDASSMGFHGRGGGGEGVFRVCQAIALSTRRSVAVCSTFAF